MTFVMAVVAILGFAGLALLLQIGVRALVVSGGAFLAAAGITVAVLLASDLSRPSAALFGVLVAEVTFLISAPVAERAARLRAEERREFELERLPFLLTTPIPPLRFCTKAMVRLNFENDALTTTSRVKAALR
jgi:hypothetical protein